MAEVERCCAAAVAREHLRMVERMPKGAEYVEWGVRWDDGTVTSTGWMEGTSEHFARRSFDPPNPMHVFARERTPVAVIRRTRTIYDDSVTDWAEDTTPTPPEPLPGERAGGGAGDE
jgi:hypothetical protein